MSAIARRSPFQSARTGNGQDLLADCSDYLVLIVYDWHAPYLMQDIADTQLSARYRLSNANGALVMQSLTWACGMLEASRDEFHSDIAISDDSQSSRSRLQPEPRRYRSHS